MEPPRQLRARSPRHRRPPPLLVIAGAGLVLVIGLGLSWLIFRPDRGRPTAPIALDPQNLDQPRALRPAVPGAPPNAAPAVGPLRPTRAPASPPTVEAPPAEVPEWERRPLRTSQPFPEEARIDPPLPPIKIPPEMLLPPALPNAGAGAGGAVDADGHERPP
jgi:hypothetical protein